MNIWDSVQRGLEKASNEAGRIAKAQRLRSSIDKLGRQVSEREAALINSVMYLFSTGALNQAELHPLCQELVQLRQQIAQIQSELQQLNAPPPSPPGAGFPGSNTGTLPPAQTTPPYPPQTGGSYTESPLVLPPDHPYANTANSTPMPPPPPGMTPVSAPSPGFEGSTPGRQEAQPVSQNPLTPAMAAICPRCGKPVQSANAFCQNCGAPLVAGGTYQPTLRVEPSLQIEDNATRTDIVPPEHK